jgi:hypothetical protein
MKLTVLDISIIIDTLSGSLRIKDGNGYLFKYSDKGRESLLKKIVEQANQTDIGVEDQ